MFRIFIEYIDQTSHNRAAFKSFRIALCNSTKLATIKIQYLRKIFELLEHQGQKPQRKHQPETQLSTGYVDVTQRLKKKSYPGID